MQPTLCQQCNQPIRVVAVFCENCGANTYSETDPLIGRTVAKKFLIERQLGSGGFSIVYAAQDLMDKQPVALKILRPPRRSETEAVGRFRRESLVGEKLNHPHIIQTLEVGEEPDGLLWISMELLSGETLDARLKRDELLSPDAAYALFAPLLDALHFAHQNGIIHRDLKPQNIFICKDVRGALQPKLLDFGMASFLESDTLTANGAVAGSPPYMPPEQWEGLARTDLRSDIYSIGVALYRCLSGGFPFQAKSPAEWMKRHYFEAPRDILQVRAISSQLANIVMRCLQKRPEDRFSSALQLKEGLASALSASIQDTVEDSNPEPIELVLDAPPPPPIKKQEATHRRLLLPAAFLLIGSAILWFGLR